MPIWNPLIQINIGQGNDPILAVTDPNSKPLTLGAFWLNSTTRTLFISIDTNSVADWIGLNPAPEWGELRNKPEYFPVDVSGILSRILVQNGQVLTTENNVIFED